MDRFRKPAVGVILLGSSNLPLSACAGDSIGRVSRFVVFVAVFREIPPVSGAERRGWRLARSLAAVSADSLTGRFRRCGTRLLARSDLGAGRRGSKCRQATWRARHVSRQPRHMNRRTRQPSRQSACANANRPGDVPERWCVVSWAAQRGTCRRAQGSGCGTPCTLPMPKLRSGCRADRTTNETGSTPLRRPCSTHHRWRRWFRDRPCPWSGAGRGAPVSGTRTVWHSSASPRFGPVGVVTPTPDQSAGGLW